MVSAATVAATTFGETAVPTAVTAAAFSVDADQSELDGCGNE
jgi:hypothetical protein